MNNKKPLIPKNDLHTLYFAFDEFLQTSFDTYQKEHGIFAQNAKRLNDKLLSISIPLTPDTLSDAAEQSYDLRLLFATKSLRTSKLLNMKNPHCQTVLKLSPLNDLYSSSFLFENNFPYKTDIIPFIYEINPEYFIKHINEKYHKTIGGFKLDAESPLLKIIDFAKTSTFEILTNSLKNKIPLQYWFDHPFIGKFIKKEIDENKISLIQKNDILNLAITRGSQVDFEFLFEFQKFPFYPTVPTLSAFVSQNAKKDNFNQFFSLILDNTPDPSIGEYVILRTAISLGKEDICTVFLTHPKIFKSKSHNEGIKKILIKIEEENQKEENKVHSKTSRNMSNNAIALSKIETKRNTIAKIQKHLQRSELYINVSEEIDFIKPSKSSKNKI